MKDESKNQSGRDRNLNSPREKTSSKRDREQNTSTGDADTDENRGSEMDTNERSSFIVPDNYERDSE